MGVVEMPPPESTSCRSRRRHHRFVVLASSSSSSSLSSCSSFLLLSVFLLSLSVPVSVEAASLASSSSSSSTSSISNAASSRGGNSTAASFLVGRQHFPTTLKNIVLDETTNQVIIGAKNHLYHLDENMRILQDAVTGPKNDSYDCTIVECPQESRRELTNNYNKVLLVHGQSLIVCGTLFQGVCEVRNLRNVSVVEQTVQDAVVANNETSSTFAFIAPGPPTSAQRNVLYVGVTFTGNSPYRSEIPAVASRSLEQNRMFQIASTAVTTGTRVIINNSAREHYLVNYVYGFSSDGFSYFLTTQPKHTTGHGGGGTSTGTSSREHVTKLVRICQDDANYYSYTEIPVECTSGTKRYNLVQGAVLGKPGADLAGHLQVTVNDDVLYAVFVEENSTAPGDQSSSSSSFHHHHQFPNISIEADRQYNSAVCVFSMKAIRRTFMENIKKCFNGQGERGLDFLSPSMKCVSTKLQTISEDFCGLDVNSPLGGDMPITALPIHVYYGRRLTGAVLTDSPNGAQVIFIADSEGSIMKLIFDEKQQQAVEYDRIDVVNAPNPVTNTRSRKVTTPSPNAEDHPTGGREFISNRGMIYDKYRRFLYAITQTKLHKIRIANCALADNCQQCLAKRDPYCGWCSLENKCTEKSECQVRNEDLYWVNGKSGKCTQITHVQPKELQRTISRTLELVIENLPVSAPGGDDMKLVCVFGVGGNKVLTTEATRKRNGVNCTTPRPDLLPPIAPGENAIVAELAVQKVGGPKLVSTNFTFFDCSTHLSCTVCVSSKYPCDWCVEAHRCTHDTAENCRNDILVTGVSRNGPSYRSGPTFCPTINSTGNESNEILVSSGSKKGIKVKVHIIGQFIVQTRFVCQFNIEGRVTSANAQLLGDTIYCDPIEFLYTSRSPNLTATFAVIWGGSKPLDNPNNMHVLIYRCRDMASNCGECLGLDEKFNCGWCSSSGTCEITEQCGSPGGAMPNNWLDRNEVCPNPEITSFRPLTGPWEGSTNITIQGINLGKDFDGIYSAITIAGISCQPYEHLYVKTREIVCKVDSPGVQKYHPGKIVVQIQNYRGESKTNYQFVDPVIRDFAPKFGPRSGGTTLTIYGEHLNAGSSIQAFIDNLPCEILTVEPTEALCKTSEFLGDDDALDGHYSEGGESQEETFVTIHRGRLKMTFDGNPRELTNQHFDYVEDPEISIVSSSTLRMPLKPQEMPTIKFPRGIPAGGLQVHVYGKNFNSIQKPKFIVRSAGRMFLNDCQINSTTYMVCYTPEIDVDSDDSGLRMRIEQIEAEQPLQLEYDFELDGVRKVFDKDERRTFELYSNPEYFPFDDNVKFYKSEYLTINGKNLDNAAKTSDVRIMIGPYECNVTSLSHGQLTCRPPSTEFMKQQKELAELATSEGRPLDLEGAGVANADKEQFFVVVKIGNSDNLVYKIGILSYAPPNSMGGWSSANVIISVALVGLGLLICVIVLIIQYRRKSNEGKRVLKNMQEQMDILELRVAAECKEAFAELQTEMTDLTSELISSGGIPFLDYKHYIIKILFPDQQQSYYFLDLEKNMSSSNGELLLAKERGLRLFGQLVMNKTFLLLFIRTLETNRYFSMRERVNVASLIMVTLQSKLEYCTDILKTLLAELIEKCMTDGKSHPRLLLRRTESVAEKMLSAWFTFLLYKFLRECAGEPLYMLFRAVKGQLEKGPIDAITSEARYSLSEEKLIRQLIDFKSITIYVSINQQIQQSHHQIQTQVYSDEESETLLLHSNQNQHVMGQFTYLNDNIPVKVLDCDSIGEVKEKCLDHIYKNTPFSLRPQAKDLDLEWRTGNQGRMILYDEDQTSAKIEYDWKKLNTLAHYRIPDGATLNLIPKQSSIYNTTGGGGTMGTMSEKKATIRGSNLSRAISPPLLSTNNKHLDLILNTNQQQIPSSTDSYQFVGQNQNARYWHLVKHDETGNDNYNQKDSSKQNDGMIKDSASNGINFSSLNNKDDHNRVNKMVSEIYLTRLLAMKGVLQKFVDDLFETIFSTAHRGSALPLAIKYMFDFLDDQAQLHGIADPEVVHTWKSNSLPLRFWVNLIKNPNFIFDIHKSNTVDSCLSVVAQTFMDSCSTSGHRLGKDSPSSKLLYAKDIPNYRKWVERYYSDIREMPAISDQDMNAMLAEESRMHTTEFNTNCALHELYMYAVKYNEQLTVTLEEDEFSQKQRLAYKLEQVHNIMSQ